MKARSRSIIILGVLFGYILLQFLWWEVLLVRQTGQIIDLKQKISELSITSETVLIKDIQLLHQKKKIQVIMVVGEGTVFLLLLLFGIYKIKQAQDKEANLNNQQKNFFLSITHELKTPIAATKLQLQTLQKQKLPETTQQELIANALTETERLNSLIDNVLLASRLDAQQLDLKLENQNISDLVQKILNRYYKKEINLGEIKTNIDPGIFAKIDENSFPSIVTNLVDNALKYSPKQKQILVSLLNEANSVSLSVEDTGVGILESDKERVFHKFIRVGNEATRSSKGTGLGLYIVKDLVKKHQAQITVKDNKPQGSIFKITFNVT